MGTIILSTSIVHQGIARTQSPTNKNYAFELPTFGVIVGVSQAEVQWKGLALEEPPSWSRFTSTPGKYTVEQSFLWTWIAPWQTYYWIFLFYHRLPLKLLKDAHLIICMLFTLMFIIVFRCFKVNDVILSKQLWIKWRHLHSNGYIWNS